MKKILLFVAALAMCAASGYAALTALHIHTTTQGVITLMLEDKPMLIFNDDRSIDIIPSTVSESEPISVSFDDVETCKYGDTDPSTESVGSIAGDESSITVRIGADAVTFEGIAGETAVEVYNIAGMHILTGAPCEGSYVLSRGDLQRGIYIVRIGKFVTKLSI